MWDAFWGLTSDRPPTFGGVAQISFLAIDRYAARYSIDHRDDFDRFVRLIHAMDATFLQKIAEDAKKGSDGANS